jgi:3-hydroxyacyl-CoA dehydrogenase
LGVRDLAERLEREGRELPPLVQAVLRTKEGTFYRKTEGRREYFDLSAQGYRPEVRSPQVIVLSSLREEGKVVASNPGASLIDLGDGVACLEFHTKMNTIGEDIIRMLHQSLEEVRKHFDGLVIGNQGRDFSVGANLMLLLLEAQEGNWEDLDLAVRQFQRAGMAIKYFDRPVVAAPFGRTLAGGCEICLAAPRIQAAAETYMGLVEVGVGLIPAGGGTKEMVLRSQERVPEGATVDLLPLLRVAFETIAMAKVSTSAEDARRLGFLRPTDGISMNPDHLLYDAKQAVLEMVRSGYRPPLPRKVRVVGERGRAAILSYLYNMRVGEYITPYEEHIGRKLAYVMTGGDVPENALVTEEYLLDLEREAFLSLLGEPKTQERIRHMLQTGKPLRN